MSVWKTALLPQGLARFCRSLALAVSVAAAGSLVVAASPDTARADGIYFNGGGFGVAIGTGGYGYRGYGYRGYRGAFFFGPGLYGPPYRPYGPPYYYHPYDRRAYPYRSRVYVNPPRHRYRGQPQRVPYTKTGLAPFTPQWVAYCSRKFKSFNPSTGTYLAYSGKYRFCR